MFDFPQFTLLFLVSLLVSPDLLNAKDKGIKRILRRIERKVDKIEENVVKILKNQQPPHCSTKGTKDLIWKVIEVSFNKIALFIRLKVDIN